MTRTGLGSQFPGPTTGHVHSADCVTALDKGRLSQEKIHALSHVAHSLAGVRVPGEGEAD